MPVKLRRKPFTSNRVGFDLHHNESMAHPTWFSSRPKGLEEKLNDVVAAGSLLMLFGMITFMLVNR